MRKGLLLACCCASSIHAQFVIDSWTTENGLPQNSVLSIQQTPDGYLWFTTFDGLVRFDGVRFTVFNKGNSPGLTSNRFIHVLAEQDGTLWASTEGDGLVRYQGGHFETYTIGNGLLSNRMDRVARDIDGSLLINTYPGIAHLRAGHIIAEARPTPQQRKSYVSPSGTRWEADAKGLRMTKGGRETRFPLPTAKMGSLDYDFHDVEMLEAAGALWVSAPGALYRLAGGVYTTYAAKDGLPNSFIRGMISDHDGNLWLATDRDGVCRLRNEHISRYTTADGLSSNHAMTVFQDREGSIWVGTNERGLNRLTRRVVTVLSTAAGLPDKNVYPILEDRSGDVWVGAGLGVARMRGGRVIQFFGNPVPPTTALYEDRAGRLWIGTESGVEYYRHGQLTNFTADLGLPIYGCAFIYEDRAGALWFGTTQGVVRYQHGTPRRYGRTEGLPNDNAIAVQETRDGTLWVGTSGGLARFDGNRFVAYTERDGLASNHVRAIYEDAQGTLWIGTYDGGLSRFRDGRFTNYTTATGLFSNGVFKILEDAHGNFWMSSNQGIYRVSRRQLEDVAAHKIASLHSTAFGKSDGMLNAECNGGRQQAGIKTRDGRLWFPTQDGIAVIDPDAVPYNRLPPPVVIESAEVQGRPVRLTGGLRLKPNAGSLNIRYTGLSLIKPEQVRFHYQLQGLDTQWLEAGTARSAFYPYLPPGHYVFQVIAANSDLVLNQNGATLAIEVLPPFYGTWWFYTLASLAVLSVAYGLWRRRIAHLEQAHATQLAFSRRLIESQENERKRMAAELHDSLGQHLLVIKNRAALGIRMVPDADHARQQLDEITASASQAIDEVRQITSNLRPLNLERLGATSVIEELIEKISNASGIQFSADIAPLEGSLTGEGAIHLYRIIQESINNIVKHGHATKARVEIWREGREIHVTVADNGRGFNPEAPARSGLGMTSMAERVRMLGGTHTVLSTPGAGTEINIRIPAADLAKGAANGA